jgi:hypothetical protein
MGNLVFSQRNVLLGASDAAIAHVHGNGLDGAALLLRKLGKTAVCAFLAVAVGNSFHRAAIQIVQQCDVVVPLPEGLLIDANSGHWLVGLSGLLSSDGSFGNVPRFVPPGSQDSLGPFDGLGCLQSIDCKSLEEDRETTTLFGPRQNRLFDSMLWAMDSRRTGMKDRAELHGIQVSPAAGRGVIVDNALLTALRAAEVSSLWGLHVDIDLLGLYIQLHISHEPRLWNA